MKAKIFFTLFLGLLFFGFVPVNNAEMITIDDNISIETDGKYFTKTPSDNTFYLNSDSIIKVKNGISYVKNDGAEVTITNSSSFSLPCNSIDENTGDVIRIQVQETPSGSGASGAVGKTYTFVRVVKTPTLTNIKYDTEKTDGNYFISNVKTPNCPFKVYYEYNNETPLTNIDEIKALTECTSDYTKNADDKVPCYFLAPNESHSPLIINAYLVDCFENISVKTITFPCVDFSKPTISASYSNYENEKNGIYYYSELSIGQKAVTLSAQDTYSDISDIVVPSNSGYSVGSSLENKTISFNGLTEGIYEEIEVQSKDDRTDSPLLSDILTLNTLVLDKTAPLISNVMINGEPYVKDNRAEIFTISPYLSFEVTEVNIKSVEVVVDNYTYNLSPDENGLYGVSIGNNARHKPVSIVVTDLANHRTIYNTDDFLVDTEKLNVSRYSIGTYYLSGATGEDTPIVSNPFDIEVKFDDDDIKNVSLKIGEKVIDEHIYGDYAEGFVDNLEDGTYTLSVTATDLSGNVTEWESAEFIVDTTKPLVSLTHLDNKLKITISEPHPNDTEMANLTASLKSSEGDIYNVRFKIGERVFEGDLNYLLSVLHDISLWEKLNNTYSIEVEFLTNANYKFECSSTDIAGNTSDTVKDSFVFDNKEPEFRSASFDASKKYDDFSYIEKTPVTMSINLYDETSDIKSVTLSYEDTNGRIQSLTCDKKDKWNFSYTFGKTVGSKGKIKSITVEDTSNNKSVTEFDTGVIVDKETDTIELLNILISDNTNGKKVINEDLKLDFKVSDTFSGIKNITYTIGNDIKTEDFSTKNRVSYEKEYSLTLPAKDYEGDNIPVKLMAEDNAGHIREIDFTYSIDVTKPQISITYDNTTENNFYNKTRTATITIKDKHFSKEGTVVNVTKDDTTTHPTLNFTTNNSVDYTATIPFDKDGDYLLSVVSTDLAGNIGNGNDTKKFVIDKEIPQVEITFDNNNASNERYYNNSRNATITIKEHNFDPSLISLNMVGQTNISAFNTNGDVHMANIPFSDDGEYSFTCKVTDKAGNESQTLTFDSFVIDRTPPTINSVGVSDNQSYKDNITPKFSATDENFENIEVSQIGGENNLDYEVISSSKEGSVFFSSIPKEKDFDDIFKITAKAKDLAGNTSENTICFKVNRFGSSYRLSKYTKEVADDYYVSPDKNFKIIAENVNQITKESVYYAINGDVKKLSKDKDFFVTHKDKNGFNDYEYEINVDKIKEDGVYTFTVNTTDELDNTSSNKEEAPLSICIDKTEPIIAVSGVTSNGIYKENTVNATIDVSDNICLKKFSVNLNGEKKTYTDKDLTDGKLVIPVNESIERQTLSVVAYDMAGNKAEYKPISFIVSSNAIATFVHSDLVLGLIVGVSVFGIFMMIALVIRKKKMSE